MFLGWGWGGNKIVPKMFTFFRSILIDKIKTSIEKFAFVFSKFVCVSVSFINSFTRKVKVKFIASRMLNDQSLMFSQSFLFSLLRNSKRPCFDRTLNAQSQVYRQTGDLSAFLEDQRQSQEISVLFCSIYQSCSNLARTILVSQCASPVLW